jgi:hypothetical protein
MKNAERELKEQDVTILVNSCDLYDDAWYPFFKLLSIQWPNCPYKAVLNTETKKYDCPFFDVETINTGTDLSWTGRLRYVLNQIDSEFVLFFLEDFFLINKVDEKAFNKALDLIKNNEDIGMVHFVPTELSSTIPKYDLDNCFYELPVRKQTLRTRVAVTLFRKKYFVKLLYGDENPWQYERESNIRSMFAGCKIYRQNYDLFPPAFSYILNHDAGIGITARKWLKNTKPFLESMGIYDVNYDNLGILSDEVINQIESSNKSVKTIGLRQWLYNNVKHPIKVRLRHFWLLQDLKNMKKYIKYYRYYKNYDDNE